ncbi:proline--tRNA ligase [Spirochaeta thermophila]|nr:proline--tRNA ligase [Spirochaeta thermophila]
MRYSQLFPHTLRTLPREHEGTPYGLLVKGGYVRGLGQGLYSFLPLGLRVFYKLKRLIAGEMKRLGGQEVLAPLVNPMELWERSGRDLLVGGDLVKFSDRAGRQMVISPTHEEAMVELLRQSMRSYRMLPVFLYQFQTKYRDEERVRIGLLRSREFIMKDGYSFHRTYADLNNFFPKVFHAYERVFRTCNVPYIVAEAGVGYMGGERSYEFLVPSERGDNVVIRCPSCGYTANQDIAIGIKPLRTQIPLPMEEVETPGCVSMDDLVTHLSVPKSGLAKTMAYHTGKGLVLAVVRGDYEVSTEKLSQVLGTPVFGLASSTELRERGLVPGYLSPLDRRDGIVVVVDTAVADSSNLVIGSGREDHHYVNANFGRDFEGDLVADIAKVWAGHRCYYCGTPMQEERAVEIGHIFKLGDFYSQRMGLSFVDERGREIHPYMGSYGIGMGRLISMIVETNSDEHGIVWPPQVAPFMVFLMSIGNSLSMKRKVEALAEALGDRALLDDRHLSPGRKFLDADLLGIPYRILLTQELLEEGKVEVKERSTGKVWKLAYQRVEDFVHYLEEQYGPV